jgi:N utilization substance protein A
LTGWRIDIKSEEEKRREVEAQFDGLEAPASEVEGTATESVEQADAGDVEAASQSEEASSEIAAPYSLPGVSEKTVRKLVEAGLTTIEILRNTSVEQLSEIPGIGAKTAERILAAAAEEAPVEESPSAQEEQ